MRVDLLAAALRYRTYLSEVQKAIKDLET